MKKFCIDLWHWLKYGKQSEGRNKMSKICVFCKTEIPSERLKILPNTDTCVNCSTEKPYKAHHVIESKTEYHVEPVKADNSITKLARKRFGAQVPFNSYKFMNKVNAKKGL